MLIEFGQYFLILLWFFLPAAVANMICGLVRYVPFLNQPIDFGHSWRGKRIFGDHKTFRGFFFGIMAAIIVAYVQVKIYNVNNIYYSFDYSKLNFWLWGFLSGFGALFGDLIRSFFKRRIGIKPGGIWFPFDQADYIIGAAIFTSLYGTLSWRQYLASIIFSIIVHPLINYMAYLLKIQKNKF